MELVIPTPSQFAHGLRALKTLALVDGDLAAEEVSVLAAAQQSFGDEQPVDTIAAITPAELAAEIDQPAVRYQLFGGLVVMAMSDGEVNEREARLVADFAQALDIDDAAVQNLERFAKGHYLRARLDIARRQWAPRKLREMARRDGVGTYYKAVLGMLRLREDPELLMRYQALGEYPAGSLGRAYFDYMVENGFAFPGERGAPIDVATFHDFTHVLSGYGTTPEEEILVATFSAGYSNREVVNWLVFVLAQFQLGLQIAPNVPPARLKLDARRLITAFRRGAAMNVDLNEGWDPWPVLGEPVEALRARYNILSEADFLPHATNASRRPS